MPSTTLYATADRARYFLVPDDARFPPGDLVVRSLTGRKLEVEAMALEVFEIPEDQAKQIAQQTVSEFGQKALGVLGAAVKAMKEAPRLDPEVAAQRAERVAETLKLSAEQLRDDPKAVGAAVKSLLEGLVKAAQETVVAPELAAERMKDVGEALRQQGVDPEAAAKIEALPDRIRAILGSEETVAAVELATERLRAAAADLRAEIERDRAKNTD